MSTYTTTTIPLVNTFNSNGQNVANGAMEGTEEVTLSPETQKLAEKHHKDVNLRYLVADLALKVEQQKDHKIRGKIDEIKTHKQKIEDIAVFVNALSTELRKPEIQSQKPTEKCVQLQNLSPVVERLRANFPDEKLTRTSWTVAEAEELYMLYTRKTDLESNDLHQKTIDLNRLFEEKSEIIPILRKILEDQNDHVKNINSKTGKG